MTMHYQKAGLLFSLSDGSKHQPKTCLMLSYSPTPWKDVS